MVTMASPPGRLSAGNRQPSETDIVHDHVGPGEHQIVAVARTAPANGSAPSSFAGSFPR